MGVVVPNGSFTTPLEKLAPHKIATNTLFISLAHPTFAQVQDFLGFPVGRPTAPYDYTNTWGSAYALLLPFFFIASLQSPDASRRRCGGAGATLSGVSGWQPVCGGREAERVVGVVGCPLVLGVVCVGCP